MRAPSFRSFITVLAGWLFAPRRTIIGMLVAAGVAGKRHHAASQRVFSAARWSLDELGLIVVRRVRTQRVMTPMAFMARVAALIPSPHIPTVRYHATLRRAPRDEQPA